MTSPVEIHEGTDPIMLPRGFVGLAEEVARIQRHIPCLRRAAADEAAEPRVRAAVLAELHACETALRLLGVEP